MSGWSFRVPTEIQHFVSQTSRRPFIAHNSLLFTGPGNNDSGMLQLKVSERTHVILAGSSSDLFEPSGPLGFLYGLKDYANMRILQTLASW